MLEIFRTGKAEFEKFLRACAAMQVRGFALICFREVFYVGFQALGADTFRCKCAGFKIVNFFLLQVWREAPFGFTVRMAHVVSRSRAFAAMFTNSRHRMKSRK